MIHLKDSLDSQHWIESPLIFYFALEPLFQRKHSKTYFFNQLSAPLHIYSHFQTSFFKRKVELSNLALQELSCNLRYYSNGVRNFTWIWIYLFYLHFITVVVKYAKMLEERFFNFLTFFKKIFTAVLSIYCCYDI